jgi:hypothetical protein
MKKGYIYGKLAYKAFKNEKTQQNDEWSILIELNMHCTSSF